MLFIACTLGVLAADLWFKAWSFRHIAGEPVLLDPRRPEMPGIPYHEPVTVVPYLLSLRLWTNTGAVFGIGKGGQWFFALVSLVATIVIGTVFWRSDPRTPRIRVMHVALALILGGAWGNLYDRIRFNAVRDMFWLFPEVKLPFGWHWPGVNGSGDLYPWLFNIADAALVVGVSMLMFLLWQTETPAPAGQSDRG